MAKAALQVVEPEADAPPSEREILEAKVRRYLKDMADAETDRKAAADVVKSIGKKAKADGLEVGILKKILVMATWTPEEVRVFFANLRAYAQSIGLPTNSQGDLFEAAFDPKVPEAARLELTWGIRGYRDGMLGRGWAEEPPSECPAGGARQEYARRWEEGQRDRQEAYAAADESDSEQ